MHLVSCSQLLVILCFEDQAALVLVSSRRATCAPLRVRLSSGELTQLVFLSEDPEMQSREHDEWTRAIKEAGWGAGVLSFKVQKH